MKIFLKIILLFGFVFLIQSHLKAQPSITWQRTYNGPYNNYESGRFICQASDGNYFVSGLTYIGGSQQRALILKITPYGDTLWWRVIENSSISAAQCCASTDDDGCIITGDGVTNFAVRINGNGSIRWIKYYGAQDLINYDIKKTKDGGYVFCGRNIDGLGYITKIDETGNLIWERTYSNGFSINLRSILNTNDSGYIVFGIKIIKKLDPSKILILKIDSAGKVIWEKTHLIFNLGAGAQSADFIREGYLIGGTSGDTLPMSQGSSFFARVDYNGNIIFSKIFYSDKQEYFYDIKKSNENRYVIAVTRQDSNLNAKTYITDSLGTIIYEKIFPNNFFNAFRSILPLSNGDILLAGIFEFGFSFPQRDIYVVRTDSMLNSPPLSVLNKESNIPEEFRLFQNYPNPFNPSTTIEFEIRKSSFASIKIFDITGKEIYVLVNKNLSRNNYKIYFFNTGLSSGIYFYQLFINGIAKDSKNMVILK